MDTQNKSRMLVTMSIESESPYSSGILHVHLGSTTWHAGDANGHANRADALSSQADESRGLVDVLGMLNSAETAGISCSEGAWTYLGARGANHIVNATNGIRCHVDMLTGPTDTPSIETDMISTRNAPEIISILRKQEKPPNSPSGATRRTPGDPNGCRSHADVSSIHRDMHSIGNDTETPANGTQNVSTPQKQSKPPDLPSEGAKWHKDEPNGCGSCADASSIHTDMHSIETRRKRLETKQNTSASIKTSQKCRTHLWRPQNGTQMSQTAVGAMQMGRAYARVCRALEMTWK